MESNIHDARYKSWESGFNETLSKELGISISDDNYFSTALDNESSGSTTSSKDFPVISPKNLNNPVDPMSQQTKANDSNPRPHPYTEIEGRSNYYAQDPVITRIISVTPRLEFRLNLDPVRNTIIQNIQREFLNSSYTPLPSPFPSQETEKDAGIQNITSNTTEVDTEVETGTELTGDLPPEDASASILKEMVAAFTRERDLDIAAPITTAGGGDSNGLQKKLHTLSDKIKRDFTTKYGEALTTRISKRFQYFVTLSYNDSISSASLRKDKTDCVKKVIAEACKTADQKFNYKWLSQSDSDIRKIYFQGADLDIATTQSLGTEWSDLYKKLLEEEVTVIKPILTNLKSYKLILSNYIDINVYRTKHSIENQKNRLNHMLKIPQQVKTTRYLCLKEKVSQVIKIIHDSLNVKNRNREREEKKRANKALTYALNKFIDYMDSKADELTDPGELKRLKNKVHSAILKSFYNVPGFAYNSAWNRVRKPLDQALGNQFWRISTRNNSIQSTAMSTGSQSRMQETQLVSETNQESIIPDPGKLQPPASLEDTRTKLTSTPGSHSSGSSSKRRQRTRWSAPEETRSNQPLARGDQPIVQQVAHIPSDSLMEVTLIQATSPSAGASNPQPAPPIARASTPQSAIPATTGASAPQAIPPTAGAPIPQAVPPASGASTSQSPMYGLRQSSSANSPNTPTADFTRDTSVSGQEFLADTQNLPSETKRNRKRRLMTDEEFCDNAGIGIFFTSESVHVIVQVKGGTHDFHLPTKVCVEQGETTPIYVETCSQRRGHFCNNVASMATKSSHIKSDAPSYVFNGVKSQLWSEEPLAWLFTRIKARILTQWNRNIQNDRIIIGLPGSVPSSCKMRLKSAIILADLPKNVVFVQATTAIGLLRKALLGPDEADFELAVYIHGTTLDVALLKINPENGKRKVKAVGVNAFRTFPTLSSTENSAIVKFIGEAVADVCKKSIHYENRIKRCSIVVDESETARFNSSTRHPGITLENLLDEAINSGIPQAARPLVPVILTIKNGILPSLLRISQLRWLQAGTGDSYREVFPFDLKLQGVKDEPNELMKLISKNDTCSSMDLPLIRVAKLGTIDEPAPKLIAHYGDRSTIEAEFYNVRRLQKDARNISFQIKIDRQGIITINPRKTDHPRHIITTELMYSPRMSHMPPEVASAVQQRFKKMLQISEDEPDVMIIEGPTQKRSKS